MPLITVSATVINDGLMVIFYASMALVFVFTSATLNTYEQIFTVMILAFVSPVGRSDWEGFLSVVTLNNFQSQIVICSFW